MLKKSLVVIFILFYQKNKIWTAVVQNSVQIVFARHSHSTSIRNECALEDLRAEWSLFWSLLIQSNLKFTQITKGF